MATCVALGVFVLLLSSPLFTLAQLKAPLLQDFYEGIPLPRIAVIGAGVGGASAAHQLHDMIGPNLPTIDVYEQRHIGGRLAVMKIGDKFYETGGTIIHGKNEHMNHFQKIMGLERIEKGGGSFAMFNGQQKVFEASQYGWLTSIKMLWRYGWSLFTLQSLTNAFLGDFSRIYQWQKERHAFTTVPNLLLSMSDEIMSATQNSTRNLLKSHHIEDQLINELVTIATRVNYGQTPDNLHGLVGQVSLAGTSGPLWSVKGGNYQVAEKLLESASSNVISDKVTKITNITKEKPLYRVEMERGEPKEYDLVILAHPIMKYVKHQIQFEGFSTDFSKSEQEFHHTWAYFIKGEPNFKYFGYNSLDEMPDIFTIGLDDFFSSLSKQTPTDGSPATDVYKVFTNNQLTDSQLNKLFNKREETKYIDWPAYPQYSSPAEFSPFSLAPNLYHINCIEIAASAMEMSTLAGINVANLALHNWMGNSHLIDNMFVIEEKHIKLEL